MSQEEISKNERNITGDNWTVPVVRHLVRLLEEQFQIKGDCHYNSSSGYGYIQVTSPDNSNLIGLSLFNSDPQVLTLIMPTPYPPDHPARGLLDHNFRLRSQEGLEELLPNILESIRMGLGLPEGYVKKLGKAPLSSKGRFTS